MSMFPDTHSVFTLKLGRVHEVCGPGAFGFAAVQAARQNTNFLWIKAARSSAQLNPTGLSAFADPRHLLVASTQHQTETLAVAEESLRSGVLGVVIMELTAPLDLTAGRRLQLAAKVGQSTGLAIIPEGMGSNAAETRWRCAPLFAPDDSTLFRWDLIKNKSGTIGGWNVRWSASTRRINVVSETGQ